MNDITELIKTLYSKDNNIAYKCLRLLKSESEVSLLQDEYIISIERKVIKL